MTRADGMALCYKKSRLFLRMHNPNPPPTTPPIVGETCLVDSEEGFVRLQDDLIHLGKLAREWLMEFNSDKCIISKLSVFLHLALRSALVQYF